MSRKTNELLSQVMMSLRSAAPLIEDSIRSYVRMDRAVGDAFAQVWFRTRGCTWANSGSCTMCNYGRGGPESAEQMVEAVREALRTIREPVDELFVSPSGSMLDPAEVPVEARRHLLELMASFPSRKVCVETRPETVTGAVAAELATALSGKTVAVEMGLESSSAWIQRFCINKTCAPVDFCRAAASLSEHGIRVYANICLGAPFLSAEEAIADARQSTEWALTHGADLAVVFPLHVKPYTLLAWLHERDHYRPPSLWSLVEVLSRLDPALLSRVTVSWYRRDYGPGAHLIQSPTTCPQCLPRVLRWLDRFRESPSRRSLQPLIAEQCECRVLWREEVAAVPQKTLPVRVLEQYDKLAEDFGLSEWWTEHRAIVRSEALQSAPVVDLPPA